MKTEEVDGVTHVCVGEKLLTDSLRKHELIGLTHGMPFRKHFEQSPEAVSPIYKSINEFHWPTCEHITFDASLSAALYNVSDTLIFATLDKAGQHTWQPVLTRTTLATRSDMDDKSFWNRGIRPRLGWSTKEVNEPRCRSAPHLCPLRSCYPFGKRRLLPP